MLDKAGGSLMKGKRPILNIGVDRLTGQEPAVDAKIKATNLQFDTYIDQVYRGYQAMKRTTFN